MAQEPVFTFGLHSVQYDDNDPWGELETHFDPKDLHVFNLTKNKQSS